MKKQTFTKHHYGNQQNLSDDEYYYQKWIAENDITDSDYKKTTNFGCGNIFLLVFILVVLAIISHYC